MNLPSSKVLNSRLATRQTLSHKFRRLIVNIHFQSPPFLLLAIIIFFTVIYRRIIEIAVMPSQKPLRHHVYESLPCAFLVRSGVFFFVLVLVLVFVLVFFFQNLSIGVVGRGRRSPGSGAVDTITITITVIITTTAPLRGSLLLPQCGEFGFASE